MTERIYWSDRLGRGPRGDPTLADVYRSVTLAAREMNQRDFLQEWYGYACVDRVDGQGRAGVDLATHMETVLGYRNPWPLPDEPVEMSEDYVFSQDAYEAAVLTAEDRLFDVVEFLFDHISAGIKEPSAYHSYGACGWHYRRFDPEPARTLFRSRINAVLRNYHGGYLLSEAGEIEHAAPTGLQQLIEAPLITTDETIRSRVDVAIAIYRSRGRTAEQQRDAVRNLFDVLEKLRPSIQAEMLSGDEKDLFNIANNFSIRHLNEHQKGNYESALWFSWLFYVNLSTIHLLTRLKARSGR